MSHLVPLCKGGQSGKVVLKTKEARESFEQIKSNYGLKSDRRVD